MQTPSKEGHQQHVLINTQQRWSTPQSVSRVRPGVPAELRLKQAVLKPPAHSTFQLLLPSFHGRALFSVFWHLSSSVCKGRREHSSIVTQDSPREQFSSEVVLASSGHTISLFCYKTLKKGQICWWIVRILGQLSPQLVWKTLIHELQRVLKSWPLVRFLTVPATIHCGRCFSPSSWSHGQWYERMRLILAFGSHGLYPVHAQTFLDLSVINIHGSVCHAL